MQSHTENARALQRGTEKAYL